MTIPLLVAYLSWVSVTVAFLIRLWPRDETRKTGSAGPVRSLPGDRSQVRVADADTEVLDGHVLHVAARSRWSVLRDAGLGGCDEGAVAQVRRDALDVPRRLG